MLMNRKGSLKLEEKSIKLQLLLKLLMDSMILLQVLWEFFQVDCQLLELLVIMKLKKIKKTLKLSLINLKLQVLRLIIMISSCWVQMEFGTSLIIQKLLSLQSLFMRRTKIVRVGTQEVLKELWMRLWIEVQLTIFQ